RNGHHLDQSGRHLRTQLFVESGSAGTTDVADLLRNRLPDVRDLLQLAAAGDRLQTLGQPLDRLGGLPLGADLERLVLANLHQGGDLAEDPGDLIVADHRFSSWIPSGGATRSCSMKPRLRSGASLRCRTYGTSSLASSDRCAWLGRRRSRAATPPWDD